MQSATSPNASLVERLRDKWQRASIGRRATGIIVALLLEGGLILLLFTLSMASDEEKPRGAIISTFDTAPDQNDAQDSPEPEQEEPQPVEPSQTTPQPSEPVVTPPDPAPVVSPAPVPPVAIIPLQRSQVPDITPAPRPAAPAAPARPSQAYGPPNTPRSGGAGDSERVGTAPNGQPMYAAAWYREPRNDELAGYLSTAQGPGWGLIACRTAPDFRVEDCVALGESPERSNIARAVLAAAWQFQVRPPRVGGRSRIGEWVRIRIDYGVRRN